MIVKFQTTDFERFRLTTKDWFNHLKSAHGHDPNMARTTNEPSPDVSGVSLFTLFDRLLDEEGSFANGDTKHSITRVACDGGPGWEIWTGFRRTMNDLSDYDFVTLVKFEDEYDALTFKLSKP
jgi:hypothetical protein